MKFPYVNFKHHSMPKKYCVDELNNELITSNTIYIFQNISDLICIETKCKHLFKLTFTLTEIK